MILCGKTTHHYYYYYFMKHDADESRSFGDLGRGRSDRLFRNRIIGGWSSSLLLDSSLKVLLLFLSSSSSSSSSFNAKGASMEDMDDICDAMSADALWRMAGDNDTFRWEDKTGPESRLGDVGRRERLLEEEADVVALSPYFRLLR
jgi:hypothetical protein